MASVCPDAASQHSHLSSFCRTGCFSRSRPPFRQQAPPWHFCAFQITLPAFCWRLHEIAVPCAVVTPALAATYRPHMVSCALWIGCPPLWVLLGCHVLDCSSVSLLKANCNALSLLPGKVQTELNPELSKERRSCPLCQRPATAGSATIDGAQPFYDRRCNAADVDAGQPHLRCSTVSSTKPSKQASHQAECRPRQSERQWFQRAVRTLRHKGCIAGQPQWLKAAGRYMTGAVQSGLEPTEADLQSTDMQLPAGAAAAAARQGSRHGVLHKTQLYPRSEREHRSTRSWTVLQQVCSSKLLLMTGSARQRRLGMTVKLRSGTAH